MKAKTGKRTFLRIHRAGRPLHALRAFCGFLLLLLSATATASSDSVQVLHWWTSAGERQAVDVLVRQLALENITWKDAAVPGGAGLGASKVLKSRILAGKVPDATQLNGYILGQWATLGLLLELDQVAINENWSKLLYPTVWDLIRFQRHVIAAPLGVHRINNLYYNPKLFRQLGLTPPKTWNDFISVATALKRAGITPLAQSSEAWQVATVFESLVLAEGGPAYYRALFVQKNAAAFADPKLLHALEKLRAMKAWMENPIREIAWDVSAREFINGKAGMFIMGDWAKGEFNAIGYATDEQFSCVAVPDTTNYHLYSVDTLAMFALDYDTQHAQEKLAQISGAPEVQYDYNRLKGAIPVRRDVDVSKMDSCARDSARVFALGSQAQAPSLVHRMALDEESKDAVVDEVHRYFMDEKISAEVTQRRLATLIRALSKKGNGNEP